MDRLELKAWLQSRETQAVLRELEEVFPVSRFQFLESWEAVLKHKGRREVIEYLKEIDQRAGTEEDA